jgi:hypothetical protein
MACLDDVRRGPDDSSRAHRNAASNNEIAWPIRALALLVFPLHGRAEDLDHCNSVAVDRRNNQEPEEDVLDTYLTKASRHGCKLDKHASAG